MAGNYPDVPGPRMAYDRDGSVGFYYAADNVVVQQSAVNIKSMNDEGDGTNWNYTVGGGVMYLGVIFPELRDLAGFFIATDGNAYDFSTSPDTTNGLDGTWTDQVTGNFMGTAGASGTSAPYYRSNIRSLSVAGIKGIKWHQTGNPISYSQKVFAVHLYGSDSAGQQPDRLHIYQPAGTDSDAGGAYFDAGNIPQGATYSKTFRVHNGSATKTANSVSVATEVLTDASPTLTTDLSLSADGGTTWASTLSLGNLAAGASSANLLVRIVLPSTAQLSVWTERLYATAASWT